MHQVSLNNNCKGKCDHTIVAAMGVPQVYTLSSSHIYCIKLFNVWDWDWANQAAVLVYVYCVLSLFMHYIKDWQIMEAVWHIMRELLYFWKFMCDEVHLISEQHWSQVNAGMQMHVQMHACTYICLWMHVHMQACLHECIYVCLHDKWFVVRPYIDQNMPTCNLMGIVGKKNDTWIENICSKNIVMIEHHQNNIEA